MIVTVAETKRRDPKSGRFIPQSDLERFWAKVKRGEPDECWEWQAGFDGYGYGMFWLNGRTIHASRAIWIMLHGDIPSNFYICHRCDNPPCVNPAHLWVGTHQENNADKMRKGRHKPGLTNKLKGSEHGNSKLTEADVIEIRRVYHVGSNCRDNYGAIKQLSDKYGVSNQTLWRIVKYESWRHIR